MTTTTEASRIMAVKQQQQTSTTLSTFKEAKSKQSTNMSISSNENHNKSRVSKKEDSKIRVVKLRQNKATNSKLGFSLRGGKFFFMIKYFDFFFLSIKTKIISVFLSLSLKAIRINKLLSIVRK